MDEDLKGWSSVWPLLERNRAIVQGRDVVRLVIESALDVTNTELGIRRRHDRLDTFTRVAPDPAPTQNPAICWQKRKRPAPPEVAKLL